MSTSLTAAIFYTALALPAPYGEQEPPDARQFRLAELAAAIDNASDGEPDRAAALLTTAWYESRLSLRVHLQGPRKDTKGFAISLWSLHSTPMVPFSEWQTLGHIDGTERAAVAADRVLVWARLRCGSWRGAFSLYGTGRTCNWRGAWSRERLRQRILANLVAAESGYVAPKLTPHNLADDAMTNPVPRSETLQTVLALYPSRPTHISPANLADILVSKPSRSVSHSTGSARATFGVTVGVVFSMCPKEQMIRTYALRIVAAVENAELRHSTLVEGDSPAYAMRLFSFTTPVVATITESSRSLASQPEPALVRLLDLAPKACDRFIVHELTPRGPGLGRVAASRGPLIYSTLEAA